MSVRYIDRGSFLDSLFRHFKCSYKTIWSSKKLILIIILICISFPIWWYIISSNDLQSLHTKRNFKPHMPTRYLVWTKFCKIPDFDIYAADAMEETHFEDYESCSSTAPTKLELNEANTHKRYKLILNFENDTKNCCFQNTERIFRGLEADDSVFLNKCVPIADSIDIPNHMDSIFVQCQLPNKTYFYSSGYALVQEKFKIQERLDEWKQNDTSRPISVVLIGIDSLSRMHMHRSMPRTAEFLNANEWIEMYGYNKMGDNTYPNLMAILTGYNESAANNVCDPTAVGQLDTCPFVWNVYRNYGYVTAYAEDKYKYSTFNYMKVGFEVPPTDYYIRPFIVGAHQHLPRRKIGDLSDCLGFKHEAEYIYDYALDFIERYKDDSFFGFFWTNSFSHDTDTSPTTMDLRMRQYLERLHESGTLDATLVIFLSDHGMRFGPFREIRSGYYEERLPMLYIWLPKIMQEKNPQFVKSLHQNRHRLTTPYDLHMTLKHILQLSGRVPNELPPGEGCPSCQSLFYPVPLNRSCADVGIDAHWCSCAAEKYMDIATPVVFQMVNYAINLINEYVQTYKNGKFYIHCMKLSLGEIVEAEELATHTEQNNSSEHTMYRLVFKTKPNNGLFESTIFHSNEDKKSDVPNRVSRLNIYGKESECVSDSSVKKYCLCYNYSGNIESKDFV